MSGSDANHIDRGRLAEILGVSHQAVGGLLKAGLPVVQAGSKGTPWVFHLPQAVQWWGEFKAGTTGEGGVAKLDPLQEKAQKDRADRELKELELATRRGEMIPLEDVEHTTAALYSGVRAQLLAVPASIAEELATHDDPAQCNAIVATKIHDTLEAIAAADVVYEEG